MNTTIYSTQLFEEPYMAEAKNGNHQLKLLENRLTDDSTILASGFTTVSLFTRGDSSANILERPYTFESKNIALRSGMSNHSILPVITIHI